MVSFSANQKRRLSKDQLDGGRLQILMSIRVFNSNLNLMISKIKCFFKVLGLWIDRCPYWCKVQYRSTTYKIFHFYFSELLKLGKVLLAHCTWIIIKIFNWPIFSKSNNPYKGGSLLSILRLIRFAIVQA